MYPIKLSLKACATPFIKVENATYPGRQSGRRWQCQQGCWFGHGICVKVATVLGIFYCFLFCACVRVHACVCVCVCVRVCVCVCVCV